MLEELGSRVAEDQRVARDARQRAHSPRWTFTEVRRAALALSREIERRVPTLATSKWWKEERHGVFLDYNQNAKDRTTCSAYSVRPLPDARVRRRSAGRGRRLRSRRVHGSRCPRGSPTGRSACRVDARAGSLEPLLELSPRDEASGLGDAPWPPHFRSRGEGARVAPSRAKNGRPPRMRHPREPRRLVPRCRC